MDWDPTTPAGRGPCEELFAESESTAVWNLAQFGGLYFRRVPRHPHIMSRCRRTLRRFVRDEPGFSKDPQPLGVLVILTSDLLKKHPLLDKLAGLALVMSYDLCTKPSETLTSSSRDVIAHQARGNQSVSISIAQGVAASDATAREKWSIRQHSHGRFAGPPARYI